MTNKDAIKKLKSILMESYITGCNGNEPCYYCKEKEAVIKAIFLLEKQVADGCEGCKYAGKDEFEMPCLNCKRNKKDYWSEK